MLTQDILEYTKYTITIVYGDWGLNNRVLLKKHISKISKSTGKIETDEYIIKDDVEIPNSRPEEPEPPDYNQAMNELKRYNINEVIKALKKVKESTKNNDWKLYGEDMDKLTKAIDQLETTSKKQKENKVSEEKAVSTTK